MAMGITEEGAEVQSGLINIDVEPVEIPPVNFTRLLFLYRSAAGVLG
jgi:hypothetical protein